jgi:uncharacterized protein (TIRG00374 family)
MENAESKGQFYRGKKSTLLRNILIAVSASASTVFLILILAKGLNVSESIPRFSILESSVYFSIFFLVFLIDALRTVILSHFLKDPFPIKKALENSILGYFFAYITPFSAGGQPFQIYHLTREGMKSENASVIILTRWVNMLVFLSISSVVFAFKYLKYIKVGIPALDRLIWVIIIASVVFSGTIVFSILFPPVGSLLIRTIKAFHADKLYGALVRRTLKEDLKSLSEWLSTFYTAVHNIWIKKTYAVILDMAFGIVDLGIIFFVLYRAIINSSVMTGTVFHLSFIDLSAIYILLSFIVYYVPTPGASGGVEGGFFAVLSRYGNSASVMRGILMWRTSTYYYTILLGLIVLLFRIRLGKRSGEARETE